MWQAQTAPPTGSREASTFSAQSGTRKRSPPEEKLDQPASAPPQSYRLSDEVVHAAVVWSMRQVVDKLWAALSSAR